MNIREEQGYVIMGMDPYVSKDSLQPVIDKVDPYLKSGNESFLIDMREVKTMNSSMASVIVHIVRNLKERGLELNMVNVEQAVADAMESVHLSELVKIYETAIDFEMATGLEISGLMH